MSEMHPNRYETGGPNTLGEVMKARIAALEAKLAEAERDIANAVRQGKERVPDYPWSKGRESLASEAVWACAMVIEGLTKHCENVEKRLAEAEAVIAKLPRTADGVVVVPGMKLWVVTDDDGVQPDEADTIHAIWYDAHEASICYSTESAAKEARNVT